MSRSLRLAASTRAVGERVTARDRGVRSPLLTEISATGACPYLCCSAESREKASIMLAHFDDQTATYTQESASFLLLGLAA